MCRPWYLQSYIGQRYSARETLRPSSCSRPYVQFCFFGTCSVLGDSPNDSPAVVQLHTACASAPGAGPRGVRRLGLSTVLTRISGGELIGAASTKPLLPNAWPYFHCAAIASRSCSGFRVASGPVSATRSTFWFQRSKPSSLPVVQMKSEPSFH